MTNRRRRLVVKQDGEDEMMDADVSHSSLSSPAYPHSSGGIRHMTSVDTLTSVGASSDADDLDLADEDTDANDDMYIPFEEKRRSTMGNKATTKRLGVRREGSPPSSSAPEAATKRSRKRDLFQSPPISEVVKLLGLSGRWRKYGRKVMKDCPYPAHYYKCAVPGCDAKRKVWYDSNEVLQMQGKGDDHTHAPLSKSDVLGSHRQRRKRASPLPARSPEGSLSPSSSASEEAAESFYSTADSRSGSASKGQQKDSDGGKQKRVAWPRMPNPKWRFRGCTPDKSQQQQQKPTGGSTKANENSAPLPQGEVKSERRPEWELKLLDNGRQQGKAGSEGIGGEQGLGGLEEERGGGGLADSRSGPTTAGDLGFAGLYDWPERGAEDQMLINMPVYNRQHSWRRLRRQLSNDLMQFDAGF